MPPDDPATPGDDVSELDELERLAKAAGSLYWNAAVRPKGKRPRAFLFAYRRPNDVTADGFSGQVACFWDERNVDAVANVAFAEAANPAAVLALINHLRALTADRDSLRAWLQRAEDAHEIADDALLLIHRAIWPAHRYDWVSGEATGMAAAIVAGVEAAVGERDALRRAVGGLPKTRDGVPIVPGMTVWLADSELDATVQAVGGKDDGEYAVSCVDSQGAVRAPVLAKYWSSRAAALAPAAPPGDAWTTAVTTKPVPVGRDCPTCGSQMYPWDANRVYPNAESRVEMRCVSCGHRVPM